MSMVKLSACRHSATDTWEDTSARGNVGQKAIMAVASAMAKRGLCIGPSDERF